jgi:hypothetical protein
MAGNEGIIELMKQGVAPHYAFILDKSPKGLNVLAQLKRAPDEIRTRATSPATQLWEAAHFPYIVIWGTWGWSGGMTLQALDLNNLLNEALPKVMERTMEKGGMCAFIPGVSDDVLESVMTKIAELQPAAGNAAEPN